VRRSTAITLVPLGGAPLIGAAITLPILLERARDCPPAIDGAARDCPSTGSSSGGGGSSGSSRNFVSGGATTAAIALGMLNAACLT
jgi:hypothetical protein